MGRGNSRVGFLSAKDGFGLGEEGREEMGLLVNAFIPEIKFLAYLFSLDRIGTNSDSIGTLNFKVYFSLCFFFSFSIQVTLHCRERFRF